MSIYDLDEMQAAILNALALADEEAEPILAEALAKVSADIERKADGIAYVIRGLDAKAEALKTEAKALAQRAKYAENACERLKEYVKRFMEGKGIDRLEGQTRILAIRKNPPKAEPVDPSDERVPCGYEKITVTVDKAKLKADLQEGKDVPGWHLVCDKRLEVK